ncbi:MAG TPA: hypothetical protein VFX45_09050 [Solirubrobacterales bacterium]|nr:hypothetical protein [Solirubrobacterales bacterium]
MTEPNESSIPGREAREDARRIEELMRTNAELAAEVRSLHRGRAGAQSAPMPTARRLAVMIDERDALAAQLETTEAELAAARVGLEAHAAHRAELESRNAELAAEVTRLRAGVPGLLRRVRARLLRS